MIGRQCCDFAHGKHRSPYDCPLKWVCQTRMREVGRQWIKGKWFNVVVDPVFDASGDLVGAVHVIYDVTAHEILRTEDVLTGLYNRKYFEMKLITIKPGEACGIILCDIDGLKMINEVFGFAEGDTLLVEVAGILRKALKHQAIIARIRT